MKPPRCPGRRKKPRHGFYTIYDFGYRSLGLGKDDVPGDKVVDDDKVQGEQRVAADVDDFQAGKGEDRQLVNL
jgi:hypothetical protein